MIIKILKGRSFSGLLDYLFNLRDKHPPPEIEARGSPEDQRANDEPSPAEERSSETDRASPLNASRSDFLAESKQREDADETANGKRRQRGKLLVTNMGGRSKEELREHFEALAALRPDVEVNVLHAILGMPEDDVLSRAEKIRLVSRFVRLKGLDKTMYAAVEHDEHKHTEIHIISSTINLNGRLPSDSFDYDKGETIARQLEKEFSLRPNKSSRDAMSRAPTQGEWKQHEQTGKLSPPLRLQAIVNSALDREVTFTEFQRRLERRGVALRLLVGDEGEVAGTVYEFEGKHVRGRRLGRGFTWTGLQRDWPDQQERKGRMLYEPTRDHAAFSRSRSGAVGGRGAAGIGEPRRAAGAIDSTWTANKRAGRAAGAHRNPSHQTHAIGEEGRGAVRDYRSGGEGTARRDGGAPQRRRDKSHTMQGAGDGDGRRDQGRIQPPARNSPGVLQRCAETEQEERAAGGAVPRHGGDEQRHLQQGERGGVGDVGENADASQSRGGGVPQEDRGAGRTLRVSLRPSEQIADRRDGLDSPDRMRRWSIDRRYVGNHEGEPSGNDASVERRDARATKISTAVPAGTSPNALPEAGGSSIPQRSAVDEVVKKLWDSFSLSEDAVGSSATIHARKDRATEMGNDPKRPALVTRAKTPEREAVSSQSHSPHDTAKDRSDYPQAQSPSERQNRDDGERRQSGRGRSR